MKQIVAATDLSERSDRAIRRAILLARQFGGEITLVHVIDDDRPAALVQSEQAKATELVEQQGRSVADIDGVTCTSRVILGDPPPASASRSSRSTRILSSSGPTGEVL